MGAIAEEQIEEELSVRHTQVHSWDKTELKQSRIYYCKNHTGSGEEDANFGFIQTQGDNFLCVQVVSVGKLKYWAYNDDAEAEKMHVFEDLDMLIYWKDCRKYTRVPAIMLTPEQYDWFVYATEDGRAGALAEYSSTE